MDRDRRNQPPRGNNNKDSDGDGLGILFGLAAGVAAVVAGGAYLYSQSGREESTPNSSSRSSLRTQSSTLSSSSSRLENEFVLAVDATPTNGGGVLRMCNGSNKIVYFYSVHWSSDFVFPHQSDKFEMTNAVLALLSLKQEIANFNDESWAKFVIKVDNNFINTSRYSDPEDDRMLQRFKLELELLDGTSKQVSQGFDCDMKNANQLSKGGSTEWIRRNLPNDYVGYRIHDVSETVKGYLDTFKQILPTKYHAT